MTDVITQYWLDDVALAYTRIKWPMAYRGTQFVPVVFYQPTEMYDALAALPRTEEGVTLKVTCQGLGAPYIVEIKGVQIVKVEKIVTDDQPDGCRVTIADRRYRLQTEIMPQSWNLLYQGQYLEGTAFDDVSPYDIEGALRDYILKAAPFVNYVGREWRTALKYDIDGATTLPNDLPYAGQPMPSALQKMFDWWGLDLLVDMDGNFYFAARSPLGAGPEYDDGREKVKDFYDDFEWVNTAPNIDNEVVNGSLPKKIKVPFWERHTLQVPYISPPANLSRQTRTLGEELGLTDVSSLKLVQVYKTLGRFFDYENLGNAFGVDLTAKPRTRFQSSTMENTELHHGISRDRIDQQRNFTLSMIIQESERTHYAIVHAEKESQKIAWTDFALGAVGADGVVQPRDAIGDWTELYEKMPERDTVLTKAGTKIGYIKRVAIVQTHTFEHNFTINQTILDLLETPTGKALPTRPKWAKERALAEAAPFNVIWAAKETGVIELVLNKTSVVPGSGAIIGTPRIVWKIATDVADTARGAGKLYKALKLNVINKRDQLIFDLDYSLWIYVVATRNAPNDEDKFWVETIDGDPNGTVDEMWLDVDPRFLAYRDFVNKTPAKSLSAQTAETDRPNGNDGFGKILNRREIRDRANARAKLTMYRLRAPTAWSHEFLNIEVVRRLGRLVGTMDSILLDISGKVVKCELSMGVRANDFDRREEAIMRTVRQIQKIGGKKVER